MTLMEAVVRPPHSIVLIGDPNGEVPETIGGALVSATSSCVAVGTLSEADGATTIRLTSVEDASQRPSHLAFEGEVELPSSRLTVASVLDDVYLERRVEGSLIGLRIWVNDAGEPDEIRVAIDESTDLPT